MSRRSQDQVRAEAVAMSASAGLAAVISAAEGMMAICDTIGQPVAANYFSMGIDVLRAHLDLVRESGLPIVEVGEHGAAS